MKKRLAILSTILLLSACAKYQDSFDLVSTKPYNVSSKTLKLGKVFKEEIKMKSFPIVHDATEQVLAKRPCTVALVNVKFKSIAENGNDLLLVEGQELIDTSIKGCK